MQSSASTQYCFVYQEWDILRERPVVSEDRIEKIVPSAVHDTAFCTRMQQARIQQRLTIQELANRAGVTSRHISMYENGSELPGDETVAKLKQILRLGDEQ